MAESRKPSVRKKAEAFDKMMDFVTALAEFAPDEATRSIAAKLRDRDWFGHENENLEPEAK